MGGKYSEGLTVGLNQAIPAAGGALPNYTSWDSSCFSAMWPQLHAGTSSAELLGLAYV